MVRTQVQLDEQQFRELKRLAAAKGVSMAAEIREALDNHLSGKGAGSVGVARAIRSVGRFRSGRSDISTLHDEHLDEAFSE